MKRYVDEDDLLAAVDRAVSRRAGERAAVKAEVRRWLDDQPRTPALVGATGAAEILGVVAPYVARLRQQGRMPEPLDVKGSVDVYLVEDVEALATVLRAERAERAEKREARRAREAA